MGDFVLPGKILGWAAITATCFLISAVFVIIGCAPTLSQEEIDQTIVVAAVAGTRSAMDATRQSEERTRLAPTHHAVATAVSAQRTRRAPTKMVIQATAAKVASERQTRQAIESQIATRDAPAPYSVEIHGVEFVCRELAREFVQMAPIGINGALAHVSNIMLIRAGNIGQYFSAYDAETALVNCECYSTRKCKPLR